MLFIAELGFMYYCFSGFVFQNCGYNFVFLREIGVFFQIYVCCVGFLFELFDRYFRKRDLWYNVLRNE